MALSSTVFSFEIDLSHTDRQIYEHLALRVARHPSESDEFLTARIVAYCLEYREGIEFSRGLSDADDPPIAIRELTGAMLAWIDVGTPSAERLHRASKSAARVAVYVHKDARQWLSRLPAAAIHRAREIELYALPPPFIAAMVERLERRTSFALSVVDGEIFVAYADGAVSCAVTRLQVPAE